MCKKPSPVRGARTLACLARAAVQKDLVAQRREPLFAPPQWVADRLLPLLNDARDAPVLYTLFSIACLTPLSALAVFATSWHLVGALHLVCFYALLLPRFIVAYVHVTEHRPLFKTGYSYVPTVLLTPLFGVPSGVYNLHHRVMHHVEDNVAPRDISSTEPYQRDNPLHFLMYWVRHAVLTWIELPIYALRCGRVRLAASALGAELAYIAAVVLLHRLRPVATLWVFMLPYALSTLAMMFGNWCQHMFINPACPRSAYGMAYNCVASPDNSCTFNDGYHILHHLNSMTHWSDLPQRFVHYLDQHVAQEALVIEGWGVIEVGLAIFARDYNAIVDRMLLPYCKPTDPDTRQAAINMIKARLRPVRAPPGAARSAAKGQSRGEPPERAACSAAERRGARNPGEATTQ